MASGNSSTNWVSTIGGSNTQYTLAVDSNGKPQPTPTGLVNTRAVETKSGWIGQVIVDRGIVHETEVHEDSDAAMQEVNDYVVSRIKLLFDPALTGLVGELL